ncbi:hypothetical protein V8E54_002812 [Elaphomyces granulatus]
MPIRSRPAVPSPQGLQQCDSCGFPLPPDYHFACCLECRDSRRDVPARSAPLASWTRASEWRELQLGRMDVECRHCGALHWRAEVTPPNKPNVMPRFTMCCKNGGIAFTDAAIPDPPPILRALFSDRSKEARDFRTHIRQFNSALSYASIGYEPDRRLRPEELQYLFQMQGSIYHMQGPLTTEANRTPIFTQLYFLDPQEALAARQTTRPQLRQFSGLLERLDHLLRHENPFRHIFYRARDVLERHADLNGLRLTPQLRLVPNRQAGRQYDLPTQDTELSAFIPTLHNEYSQTSYRDVCLYLRDGPNRRRHITYIHFEHPLYLPLSYVLFYARGGRGFSQGIRLQGPTAAGTSFPS